jgi:hypothetical protein
VRSTQVVPSHSKTLRKGRQAARIVCISDGPRAAARAATPTSPITQERLQRGSALLLEEQLIVRALWEFTNEIEADLAAGAEVEPGDLVFDRQFKIVRQAESDFSSS